MDRERTERMGMENQLREKVREVMELQAKLDAQSGELNAK